ncbi:restriction endonuclease subunit S [Treponema pectinovorum]|uniref:restriction endonuclease subunit S n=1 Tax=Treponema pectinovorum TaxID=164 RepID=UPI0011F1272B|nr:restriction endonuclease subunit S [Treponema pectinovorum]
MPEGWAWCRLKEVCELRGGKRIPAGLSATKKKTDHIYIRVTDMHNSSISDTDLVYITDDIFEKIQRYTISKDDLYLTIAGTIGRVGEVPEKFDGMNLTENALKLTNILICKNYLMHILNSNFVQDYFESTYHQVAMPKLSLINASKTVVPIPPLAEQQKIVNKIENIFSIANNLDIDIIDLENSIKQAKSKILDLAIHGKLVPQDPNDEPAEELLKRIATSDNRPYKKFEGEEPFEIPENWGWCKLGDIGKYKKGPFGSSLTKAMFVPKSSNTVKVYEQKNAIQKNHNLGEYYITREYFESKMKSFEVFPNDVIVSCAGTIGETYILPENIEQGIINQALMKMKISKFIDINYFLKYFDHILKEESVKNGKGTAIKNIPPFDVFKNYPVPLPSLAEQQRIVTKIEELFAQLDSISEQLA